MASVPSNARTRRTKPCRLRELRTTPRAATSARHPQPSRVTITRTGAPSCRATATSTLSSVDAAVDVVPTPGLLTPTPHLEGTEADGVRAGDNLAWSSALRRFSRAPAPVPQVSAFLDRSHRGRCCQLEAAP